MGLGCPEVQVPLKWVNCFARTRFLRIALRIHVRADQPIDDGKKETTSALPIVQVLGVIVTFDRRLGIRNCASRFSVISLPHLSHKYFFHQYKIIIIRADIKKKKNHTNSVNEKNFKKFACI